VDNPYITLLRPSGDKLEVIRHHLETWCSVAGVPVKGSLDRQECGSIAAAIAQHPTIIPFGETPSAEFRREQAVKWFQESDALKVIGLDA